MCRSRDDQNNFACLGRPRTVWALSSIHSNSAALTEIHDVLLDYIHPGDRIVYLGNYTGYGDHAVETMNELLAFRRLVLSRAGMKATDFTYLRGGQEEIWQKLLQLPFAPNPGDVLLWMLGHGLSNTLYSYGLSPHDGIEACRAGPVKLTHWAAGIRHIVESHPGHSTLGTQITRAAYTDLDLESPLLFVHAGLDDQKDWQDQGDNFWWGTQDFNQISEPYAPFHKVIRGHDPARGGVRLQDTAVTIDGGCGFGGPLVCAGFSPDGNILELFEA